MRKVPGRNDGIHDVNMTPLIDVSLVLVVILMVATPLAFQSSITLRTATASGRKAAEAARTDRIELRVMADGRVQVNRTLVPREAFGAELQRALAASASKQVIVRCEDQVPHGEFVSVIDEARALGAGQIAVVGR